MATFGAKQALHALNHYDRHRVVCTCDDKRQAARLSGHTWNIINNSDKDEVYYQNARNPDHYIDERGQNTSHWFEKKKRIDLDGDGIIECLDSTNVEEVMVCPPTAGKEAAYLRRRQMKQLRQSQAPMNYTEYNGRREADGTRTPEKADMLQRKMPFQNRMRDVHARPACRIQEKHLWTPRRGEVMKVPEPPLEHDMFRAVDQLRAESHVDVHDANFADAIHSARKARAAGAGDGPSALVDASKTRSAMVQDEAPAKPAAARNRFSKNVIEQHAAREITGWPFHHRCPLRREDPFYVRPVQQTGSSSVKFDIITNERKDFWH